MSAYAYANANPVLLSDPTGLWPPLVLAGAGAGGGGIAIAAGGFGAAVSAPVWATVAIGVGIGVGIGLVIWTVQDKLDEARDARDREVAAQEKAAPGAVVGAYDPKTGKVVVGVSRRGGIHAEDNAVDQLGIPPGEVEFTEPVRPRTGKQQPVCVTCQGKYGQEQFPPGTPFEPGGPWGTGLTQ